MKRIIWLLILFVACRGPTGPPGDEREIVWLYPEDVIYRAVYPYPVVQSDSLIIFDIEFKEYSSRHGGPVWLYAYWDYLGLYQWFDTWTATITATIDDPVNIYYGKLGVRFPSYLSNWQYAYFYWDAETP